MNDRELLALMCASLYDGAMKEALVSDHAAAIAVLHARSILSEIDKSPAPEAGSDSASPSLTAVKRYENIDRAAKRVLSVFDVARSPHGAPSRVVEPDGATDALCALMDAVEGFAPPSRAETPTVPDCFKAFMDARDAKKRELEDGGRCLPLGFSPATDAAGVEAVRTLMLTARPAQDREAWALLCEIAFDIDHGEHDDEARDRWMEKWRAISDPTASLVTARPAGNDGEDVVLRDEPIDAGPLARAQLAEMHRLLAPVLEAAAFSPAHEKASDAIARLLGQWRSGLEPRIPPTAPTEADCAEAWYTAGTITCPEGLVRRTTTAGREITLSAQTWVRIAAVRALCLTARPAGMDAAPLDYDRWLDGKVCTRDPGGDRGAEWIRGWNECIDYLRIRFRVDPPAPPPVARETTRDADEAVNDLRAAAFVVYHAVKSGQRVAPEVLEAIPKAIERIDAARSSLPSGEAGVDVKALRLYLAEHYGWCSPHGMSLEWCSGWDA